MDHGQRLRKYAELVVKTGANVAPGQDVAINTNVEYADFARAVASVAYEVGARYVDIWYYDEHPKRDRILAAPEDTLEWTPPWLDARCEAMIENRSAAISLRGGPNPTLFAGLDPRLLGKERMPNVPKWIDVVTSEEVNWVIAPVPTESWAELVFGEPDVERLWDHVWSFLRLDRPDPVTAWKEHLDRLVARASDLTDRRFDAIRLRGPGTDLTVGLVERNKWLAASFETRWGQPHVPNLPTEEVFTTPHRLRADGTVTSTRPLDIRGSMVRDLKITFAGGRIVEVAASEGAEIVEMQLEVDDGAAHVGEIALVDGSSPIGKTGEVYLNTLFDENATCHIAFGSGYPQGAEGAADLDADAQLERGINHSRVHIDFMVGGPEVEVDGLDSAGNATPIIRDDVWQLGA